jgi:hypothetical protein
MARSGGATNSVTEVSQSVWDPSEMRNGIAPRPGDPS